MGKRRKRNSFKPSDVFMKAYTRTLEKAVNSKYEKSDFQCYSEYPSKFSEISQMWYKPISRYSPKS